MVLPSPMSRSFLDSTDSSSRLFDTFSRSDYELYEEDDAFVLTIEMPGFETDDLTVSWDDGVLNIAGEHEDDTRGHRRTYHRRFRFPKDIDDANIKAEYNNGVLEIYLPIPPESRVSGREIEVQG